MDTAEEDQEQHTAIGGEDYLRKTEQSRVIGGRWS